MKDKIYVENIEHVFSKIPNNKTLHNNRIFFCTMYSTCKVDYFLFNSKLEKRICAREI